MSGFDRYGKCQLRRQKASTTSLRRVLLQLALSPDDFQFLKQVSWVGLLGSRLRLHD